jgi:hypothetical protein
MPRLPRTLRTLAPALLLVFALLPHVRPLAHAASAQAMVEASGGLANDSFGTAVAVSGDVLAISAPYASLNGLSFAGAVYLFRRDAQAPSGWAEFKTLTRDPPLSNGQFGLTLALQDDVLVVGAEHETSNGSLQQGAAYVYERDRGGPDAWGLVARLEDSTLGSLGLFGSGVAVDGDLLVVGAEGAYGHQGTAYVYSRVAGWGLLKQLSDQGAQISDLFGAAVAVSGDTIVVGSERADHGLLDRDTGAAFVFERDQGGPDAWGQTARLEAPLTFANGAFGSAVGVDSDTIVVGSRFENRESAGQVDAYSAGAAYIFERDQGGAGAWGLTRSIHPDDGAAFDYLGDSVAIQDDEVWVAAHGSSVGGFSEQGLVYHFQRDEGGSGAWGALAPIEADNGGLGDRFGSAIGASGATLAVGAPGRESNRGAAYVIEAAGAPGQPAASAFLPLVLNEWYPPTGTLLDGGSLQSPSGAIIGAVAGTLAGPLAATIDLAAAPATPLPAGITPTGPYYVAATQELTIAPADTPFLVGLPVPAGADTAHLAVAAFIPGGYASESEATPGAPGSWTTVPGSYDPASNLFVITLRMLMPGGVKLALFVHPENQPLTPLPGTPSAAGARLAPSVEYDAQCDLTRLTTSCTPANRRLLAAELADAHAVFVDSHGFRTPALLHSIGVFTGADKRPSLVPTYYGAVIGADPCTNSDGDSIAGQYSYVTLQLLVCMGEPATGDEIRATVRHELFHAIQASYPNVAADRTARSGTALTSWLIEGTAAAAEKSSYILLRSPDFELRQVTTPLTSTAELNEYSAQDFWIYAGDAVDQPLSFLTPIFDAGATPQHVNQVLSMPEAYWSWAKNQAIEHEETMNGSFTVGACELQFLTVDPNATRYIFFSSQRSTQGQLAPLTSALVEIDFQRQAFSAQVLADNDGNSNDLRYKVYRENESGCEALPDGQRQLQNVQNGSKVYVLLANVSLTDDFSYVVQVLAE